MMLFGYAVNFMGRQIVGVLLFVLDYFCVMFFSAPNAAMIQDLVPSGLRACATALCLLMTSLVGFGIGPMVAGTLSGAVGGSRPPPAPARATRIKP